MLLYVHGPKIKFFCENMDLKSRPDLPNFSYISACRDDLLTKEYCLKSPIHLNAAIA